MSRFSKFNRGTRTVKEGIDTQKLTFKPLKDFIGEELTCYGFFFTDGKYGKQVVAVCEDKSGNKYNVNMPGRAVEQFEDIKCDSDAVAEVITNGFKISNIAKVETKNGETTGYDFE